MSSPAPPEASAAAPPLPVAPDGAVRYRCHHVTRYSYTDAVTASQLLAHLVPRSHPRQRLHAARLTLDPWPAVMTDRVDWFGNPVTYASLQTPHQQLTVTAEIAVEVLPPPALDPAVTPAWDRLAVAVARDKVAQEFVFASLRVPAPDPALAAFAAPSFPAGRPVAEAALDLTRRIHAGFSFDPSATTVSTPVAEVLANRRGVCQDFAHLMIGALRALGLPARYVSGYLRTLPPPGQVKLRGADASHAWVQVWCGDDAGWLDLDPTNGITGNTDHVTLAWGRDYDDVCPLRGVILGGGAQSLTVAVDVEPVARF